MIERVIDVILTLLQQLKLSKNLFLLSIPYAMMESNTRGGSEGLNGWEVISGGRLP